MRGAECGWQLRTFGDNYKLVHLRALRTQCPLINPAMRRSVVMGDCTMKVCRWQKWEPMGLPLLFMRHVGRFCITVFLHSRIGSEAMRGVS